MNNIFHSLIFVAKKGAYVQPVMDAYLKQIVCVNANKDGFFCNQCVFCLEISARTYTDLVYLDAASEDFSKSKIIQLQNQFNLSCNETCQKKIGVIDNFDLCKLQAYNSMLQFIENNKPDTFFVFVVKNVNAITKTILSRCQVEFIFPKHEDWEKLRHKFNLTLEEIAILKTICWTVDETLSFLQSNSLRNLKQICDEILHYTDLSKFRHSFEIFKKMNYLEIKRILLYLMNQNDLRKYYSTFLDLISQLKYRPNKIALYDQILTVLKTSPKPMHRSDRNPLA